jgi:hypothetical protein
VLSRGGNRSHGEGRLSNRRAKTARLFNAQRSPLNSPCATLAAA